MREYSEPTHPTSNNSVFEIFRSPHHEHSNNGAYPHFQPEIMNFSSVRFRNIDLENSK